MTWEKLPALNAKDIHIGCLNCSTAAAIAPMEMLVAVGFGAAYATKDSEVVYMETTHDDDLKTVGDIEEMAKADPDHDWRIVKEGPMHGETFQRHGDGQWVCVESNRGFA